MKDLSFLTSTEVKSFFNSFDCIFCDIDGVLWLPWKKIQGVPEGITALKKIGKKIVFLSNNTTKRYQTYVEELKTAGVASDKEDLVIPSTVISLYLKKKKFNQELYLIGNPALQHDLEADGFKISSDSNAIQTDGTVSTCMKQMFASNPNIGAVIYEIDLNANYLQLQKAVLYLIKNPNMLFIAGSSDKRLPFNDKFTLIGPGYFLEIMEEVSKRKATKVAKPSTILNEYIIDKYNITDPKRVLVIGDSILQDMAFGGENDFQKLLVLSGITEKSMLENWKWPEYWKPDYYVDGLQSIPEILEKANLL